MENNNSGKAVLIVIIAILAIAVIYLVATRGGGNTKAPADNNIAEQTPAPEAAKPDPMKAQIPAELTDEQKAQLKAGVEAHEPKEVTFNITAGSFYFTPNEIRVKQGDKVKIVLTNVLGTHDFVLEAFNVRTKITKNGENDAIEFTADKKGAFEFYCSVGNGYHRMKGQIGVLLVE
jgi:plastocyanin